METDCLSCCLDRLSKWEPLREDGRDNSVDTCHFIHAIVPRHIESVILMTRWKA